MVLATNIAETSLTIDDVAYVIDSGRAKEKSYDPHMRLSVLRSSWISQAAARQRRGRAGRTRKGICWHLFGKQRHDTALEQQAIRGAYRRETRSLLVPQVEARACKHE